MCMSRTAHARSGGPRGCSGATQRQGARRQQRALERASESDPRAAAAADLPDPNARLLRLRLRAFYQLFAAVAVERPARKFAAGLPASVCFTK